MILSSQAIALHSDFQQPSFDTMAVLVGGVGKIFGSFLGDASRDMINNAGDMVEASLVRAGQEILALIDHAASAAGRLVLRIGNESKITLQTAQDKITAVAENLSHHADLLLKKGGQEARLCLKGGVEGVQEVLLLTVPAAVRLAAADAVEAIGDGFTLARGGTPYSTLRKKLYRMLLDKESSPQKITDYLQARKNGNQGELWQCYHMVFVFYNHRDMPAENAFLWQLWIVMEAKLHAPRRNRGPVEWLRGADPWSEDFCAWVKHPREEQCQFLQRALSCLKWLPENPSIHDQAAIRPAIEDIIREALPHRVRALPAPALPAPALPPPALPPPALPAPALPAPALPAPAPPAAAPPAPAPPAPAPEDVAVQPPLQPGIWFIFKSQDGKVMGVKGPSKKENNAELLQCQEGDKVAFHQHFMLRVVPEKENVYRILMGHCKKYLDGGKCKENCTVRQHEKNENTSQHWRISPKKDGLYEIQNLGDGRGQVIEFEGITKVILKPPRRDQPNQLFSFKPCPLPFVGFQADIWYTIKGKDGKVMGVKGPSKDDTAELQRQEGDNAAFHQHFMLCPEGEDFYSIKVRHCKKYLGGGDCKENGKVRQHEKNDGDSQCWSIMLVEGGLYKIRSKRSAARVIEFSDGDKVILKEENGDRQNQLFSFVRV